MKKKINDFIEKQYISIYSHPSSKYIFFLILYWKECAVFAFFSIKNEYPPPGNLLEIRIPATKRKKGNLMKENR